MSKLLLAQRLVYSTARITSESSDGKRRTGTGFFYSTSRNEWLLITNYHVIENSETGELTLTEGDEYNQPIAQSGIKRKIENFSKRWFRHHDEKVDLCAMSMMPIIKEIRREGKVPWFTRRVQHYSKRGRMEEFYTYRRYHHDRISERSVGQGKRYTVL
jgi:hypothetical protein